jgi:hypothetical protein
MAIGALSPVAIQQFFDANGDPLAGGTLGFYLAGTTTPSPAYADVNLIVPLANPVVLDAAGRAPELFLGALTYKQVLKNALGTTIWTADNIVTPAALRSVQTITSVTGNQKDFPVPQGLIGFLYFQNTAPVTIDGFAGGTPGQLLLIRALGTAAVNLVPIQMSTATVGNQLNNFVGSGVTTLMPQAGSATYIFQGGSWVLLNHEQGAWIRVPFNAANFTADGGGTWVVDAGDITQMDYRLSGTSLLMSFSLASTVITGTPANLFISGWPYQQRTALSGMPGLSSQVGGASGWGSILLSGSAGAAWIALHQTIAATWTASSTVAVTGQVIADVN